MKGNTYILKRIYLERNQEREYENHQKRLQQIKNKPFKIKEKVLHIQTLESNSQQNHDKAVKFQIQEAEKKRLLNDRILVKKLSEKTFSQQLNSPQFSQNNQQTAMDFAKSSSNGFIKVSKSESNFFPIKKKCGIHSLGQKREQLRIFRENLNLANRMSKLPPVIQTQQHIKDYQKNKHFSESIQRFHFLKKKKEFKHNDQTSKKSIQNKVQLDEKNKKLMEEAINVQISIKSISFVNFLPLNKENEKYYFEIKTPNKATKKTNLCDYESFLKQTFKETILIQDLVFNKIIYFGLFQQKENKYRFLGDFQIDLNPYFVQGLENETLGFDLRNFRDFYKNPHHVPTDMRKKGNIEINLSINSQINQYLNQNK